MRDVSIAIVGAGSMAREHARAFASLPGVTVSGLTSRTRARAEALASELSIPLVTDSIADLHRQTSADLVVIAVPELSARPVALEAFQHPWAVLMEKPAGYDLGDAEKIATAAADRERRAGGGATPAGRVMVGLNRRFYSSSRTIKADLDTRPDDKRFIHVQDQQSYAEARRYNHPPQVVEKFMYANSIHLIDLIPFFARGTITGVRQVTPWRGEQTEVMLAYIEFDSGDTALYEGLWKGPGPWAANVSTPGKRWIMQPLEQAIYQNAGERARHTIEASDDDKQFKAGFLLQARSAVAAVRGEAAQIPSIEDSMQTMRLIHRMFGV